MARRCLTLLKLEVAETKFHSLVKFSGSNDLSFPSDNLVLYMVNYKRTTDTTYEVNMFNQRLFYKSIFHDNHLSELSDCIALNPILLKQLTMESPRFNTDVQYSLSTCLVDISDSFLSVD